VLTQTEVVARLVESVSHRALSLAQEVRHIDLAEVDPDAIPRLRDRFVQAVSIYARFARALDAVEVVEAGSKDADGSSFTWLYGPAR
jgi:hypothetical protein